MISCGPNWPAWDPLNFVRNQSDADGCGVFTEFAFDDVRIVERRAERQLAGAADYGIEDKVPRMHYLPADDDLFDVQKIDHRGDRRADIIALPTGASGSWPRTTKG